MGEKYDGIRCCWNPIENTVYLFCTLFFMCLYYLLFIIYYFVCLNTRYSRNGHVIDLIPEIISLIPKDSFFDGEVW
jgi:hypothetical protein